MSKFSRFGGDDIGDGGRFGSSLEIGEFLKQVIAGDENLNGRCGIEAAGAQGGLFDERDNALEFILAACEVVEGF